MRSEKLPTAGGLLKLSTSPQKSPKTLLLLESKANIKPTRCPPACEASSGPSVKRAHSSGGTADGGLFLGRRTPEEQAEPSPSKLLSLGVPRDTEEPADYSLCREGVDAAEQLRTCSLLQELLAEKRN